MAQLKNTSKKEWTIKGVGLFKPGEAKQVGSGKGEVPPEVAQEYKAYPGWEVIEDKPRGKKSEA